MITNTRPAIGISHGESAVRGPIWGPVDPIGRWVDLFCSSLNHDHHANSGRIGSDSQASVLLGFLKVKINLIMLLLSTED